MFDWLRVLFGLILISINTYGYNVPSQLNYSAFCQPLLRHSSSSSDYHSKPLLPISLERYHPIDPPEIHIPWLWDAIYDPILHRVELIALMRGMCKFNKQLWKEMHKNFTSYSNQLAHGLDSNILAAYDTNTTNFQEIYLHKQRLLCQYYHGHRVIYEVMSEKIRGRVDFISTGTMQIRCPAPPKEKNLYWDGIRLKIVEYVPNDDIEIGNYLESTLSNTTAIVPICNLPRYQPKQKKYGLTVCTASGRADRDQLVEWIEYHRIMGVEHFYIYDTSLPHTLSHIDRVLDDYIKEGIVTIVPWHFVNCVRYMANGRWAAWYVNHRKYQFRSPQAISQTSALGSCYSRYRHSSKYMIHIDDDEFLVMDPHRVHSYYPNDTIPATLYDLAEMIFNRHPKSAAIRFEPLFFYPCNVKKGMEYTQQNIFQHSPPSSPGSSPAANTLIPTPLPRLGVWDQYEIFKSFENKLILRTEAIGMFYIHFVSMYEYGPWRPPQFSDYHVTLPVNTTLLVHYKYPYQLANIVLEGLQPIEKDSFQSECKGIRHRKTQFFGKDFAQIPNKVRERLINEVLKRKPM